ncbi:hypothetical protein M758_3G164000 [Ceratodon purpureus]|nr:hypothetical protein M758_3G164000 [Ceratodon purpureus]
MGSHLQAPMITFVFLFCLCHVAPAASTGPEVLTTPPIWNFTMSQCGLFRNEIVLRPLFILWPESIKGVPFRYCCEYQPPTSTPLTFNLSGYRYGPEGGTLVPAPYFDLGLIDKKYKWYWKNWNFWKLPTKLYSAPIYCEVTDLHRLYMYRFWTQTFVRGVISAAPLIAILLIGGIFIPCCRDRRKLVQWEELFSDLLHVLLLCLVGSCLMEAIAHSAIREWRSQLMFNGGVVYTYLTLFAILSALFRHSINPDRKHRTDWRWQKVFGQVAAQFMVGAYLGLVEDVSGRGLEGVAGLVLGTVIGATIWSAGVEMYIISQIFSLSSKESEKCPKCKTPTCDVCRSRHGARSFELGVYNY